ncbi:MAG: biliverdin-producing heme oxygenase [Alphaproteobacteria bacterium]
MTVENFVSRRPSVPSANLLTRLRLATQNDHHNLDETISKINLSDLQGYVTFLCIHHHALENLMPHSRPEDQADFESMARCARNDLAILGEAPTSLPAARIVRQPNLHGLGVAYVVRGSRLGARFIRAKIPDGFPASYLSFAPALSWSDFLKQLQAFSDRNCPLSDESVLKSATAAFAVFDHLANYCTTGLNR